MSELNSAEPRTIAVVGGGIAGMSAAYALQEACREQRIQASIVLIEGDDRLGGKICTEQASGFTIEGGPDCFIRQKPWAAQLARKVGLRDDLIGTNDQNRKTFVVDHGRLVPLPDGVMLIIPTRIMPFALSPLISIPGKIRMGLDLFIPRFRGDGDESISAFVRRRLGSEALRKIAEPLLSGIHVSDPEDQSLLATFPRFRALEKNHGSLIRGMLAERKQTAKKAPAPVEGPTSMFVTLKGGLNQLVNHVEAALSDVQVLRGQKVAQIQPAETGAYRITIEGGTELTADALILATPAYVSAGLVRNFASGLAGQLERIRYVSTATLSLGYRKADLRKPFNGFGFVIPSQEHREISACTWSSIKFDHRAPDGAVLLRCFLGGPGKEEMVALSDEDMIAVARRELKALMGIDAEPVVTRIFRWNKANPQYDVDHIERVKSIFAECASYPGLTLAGSAYEGVGVPDCIRQGQQAAAKVIDYLAQSTSTAVPQPGD